MATPSDPRFRALFYESELAIAISDARTAQWLEVSPSWERLTGYPASEAVGKTPADLGLVRSRSLQDELLGGLLSEGRIDNVEITMTRRDGAVRTCLTSAFVVDLHGAPCLLSMARDVTEQTRTKRALEESEQRYRSLVENFPGCAVVLYDRDLRFLLVDGPEVGGAGISKETMVGRTLYECLPEEFARTVEPWMRAALEGHPTPVELPFEDRYYHYEYVPLRGASGEIDRGLILAQNVTERHRAAARLEEQERHYRTLANNVPDLIVRFGRDYRVTYVNPVIETAIGAPPSALLGKNLEEAGIAKERVARWEGALRRVFEHAAEERLESDFRGSLGVRFWEGRVVPERSADGTVSSALLIGRDVTERRQREEEAQRKNDELTRFTYAVSHDLRSPLVTIRSFLGFLRKDLLDGDLAKVERDLGFIDNAAERMDKLLHELLELSRVGRKAHPHEWASLQELASEALALVAGRIATAGTEIELTREPVRLFGERSRLMEVFLNLIDNAVKFSASKPSPRVVIGVEHGPEPVFFVADNGVGIDPRHLSKLFGLFEKLDAQSEGMGVGLALVKRIVEVHGGRIWVESDGVGKGTVVRFTLPSSGE
jgi:PAS domain S-box-containing protein